MHRRHLAAPAFRTAALAATLTFLCAAQEPTTRVFFGTQARGDQAGIYTATLNTDTGELTPPKLAAPIPAAGFLALHPSRNYLYATTRLADASPNGGVAAFRLDADATLHPLNRQASGGSGPCHVSVDATGRCLLVANYGSGSVSALAIAEDGTLRPASTIQHEGGSVHATRQTGPHAHSIYPGPRNAFAYAADLGTDEVLVYRLKSEPSTLTPAGTAPLPPGSGPRHLKFGRDGAHVYVLNELTLTIAVFARDPKTGALEQIQLIDTLAADAGAPESDAAPDIADMTCSEIRVHPNGRFVYCANRDLSERKRDSLTVFAVGDDATLTRVQIVPAEVWIPRNFALDPTGRWLLVAGQRADAISVFAVDSATGELTFTDQKAAVPSPMCVLFVDGET